MSLAFFSGGTPGMSEILIILFLILLLFGAKKLPELARAIGRSLSEFKKGRTEGVEKDEKDNAQKQCPHDPDGSV